MYLNIVNLIMMISLIKGFLWVFGLLAFGCLCWWASIAISRHWDAAERNMDKEERKERGYSKFYILTAIAFVIFSGLIALGSSNYVKPEWILLRAAAPMVDQYVADHPNESIYDPNVALKVVNDTTLSIFASAQSLPKLIEALGSGKSIQEVKAQLDKEQEQKEFEEWKAANKK